MLVQHLVLFFAASIVQFYHVLNRDSAGKLFWVVVLAGGIYFIGWWSVVTWVLGTMMGSRLAFMQISKDQISHETDS